MVFFIFIITISCNFSSGQPDKKMLPFPLPDSDIVYQIIEKEEGEIRGKELLAFYSFEDKIISKLDLAPNLITPIYHNSDTLLAFAKQGYPGSIMEYRGKVVIINENSIITCDDSFATGWEIRPHNIDLTILSKNKINIISLNDCSLQKSIDLEDFVNKYGNNPIITSYSLSKREDFIIISLLTTNLYLIKINLLNNDAVSYKHNGKFPSLSPDEQKLIYLGREGIRIMDVNGENDELIVPYEMEYTDLAGDFTRGIYPKPRWSSDGTKIIYHKCIKPLSQLCEDTSDYDIFQFDLVAKTETLLIEDGINPSFRP